MAESSVRVHISTTADTAAIAQARQALDQVRAAQGAQAAGAQAGAGAAQSLAGGMGRVSSQASEAAGSLREADRAGQGFLDTLRLGVGIDLGGRLIQGLSEIAATLQQATRDGLEFNAMLESSQITIASVLRANGARTFESAYARSGEILDGLIERARTANVAVADMIQSYTANSSLAFQAGITDLETQLDLVTAVSTAVKALKLPGNQTVQELRALMTGQINPRYAQVAMMYGIEQKEYSAAKKAGQLGEYLREKLAPANEMVAKLAGTFDGLNTKLSDAIAIAKANTVEPLFAELKTSFVELLETFNDDKVREGLKPLLRDVSTLTGMATQLVNALVKLGAASGPLLSALLRLGVGIAALKLYQLVTFLGLSTAAWIRETFAIRAHTAALTADAAASAANTVTRGAGAVAGAGAAVVGVGGRVLGGLGGPIGMGVVLAAMAAMEMWAHAQRKQEADRETDDLMRKVAADYNALRDKVAAATSLDDKEAVRKEVAEKIKSTTEQIETEKDQARAAALKAQLAAVSRLEAKFDDIAGTRARTLMTEEQLAAELERQAATAEIAAEVEDARIDAAPDDAIRKRLLEAKARRITDEVDKELRGKGQGIPVNQKDSIELTRQFSEAALRAYGPGEQYDAIRAKILEIAAAQRDVAELERDIAEEASETAAEREEAARAYEEDLEILSLRAAGNEAGAAALEHERDIRREAAEIAKEQGVDDTKALETAKLKVDYEREIAATKERTAKAEKDAAQAAESRDYAAELAILAARAAGEEDRATALERERDLQREIEAIVKSQGKSQADAAALAWQKLDLEEQVAEREREREARESFTPDAMVRSRTGRDEHAKQRHKDVYGRDITFSDEGTTLAARTDFGQVLKPRLGERLKASDMVPAPGAGPEGAPGAPGGGDAAASAQAAAAATQAATQALGQLTTGVQGLSTQLTALGEAATKAVAGSQEASTKAIGAANATIAAVNSLGNSITSALNNLEARVSNLEAGL